MQTLRGQPPDDVGTQRCLAAEQMRAAGDVEHQASAVEQALRIEPDQRRVAVAPVGDGLEQPAVGFGIGLDHRNRRIHRARIGEPMPVLSPSRAAASFTAASRIALLISSTTTSGAFSAGADERRVIRSVDSRRSQSER